MISAALALVMGLQASGEAAIAVINENPETWSVEYPRLIQPYVADYRGCLSFTIRYVTGTPDFEAQHRGDVPRCVDVREAAISESRAQLVKSKAKFTDADIEKLFDAIGSIHVQRGRDLDEQFAMRLQAAEDREAAGPPPRPEPLVITLPDPKVVKSREESLRIEP